jgi:CRP/FNR family transcriptional regulator, cyclic AMP receptor protein
MRAPYGLEIIESCVTCPHREERLFCNLAADAVRDLAVITSASSYPKGAALFMEGQGPRGVFIVCTGRVKLSTSSPDGKTLIARISRDGEVLGLPATITGKAYELTAEVIEPTQANFISLRVAEQLAETYRSAVDEMRSIGLAHSAAEKLARFLLDWCASHGNGQQPVRAKMTLTHEEIAQTIGSSRETVTRALAEFKKKKLLQIQGATVTIPDPAALQNLVDSPH